ncbi:MAG: PulJ/GspJ family protein [Candidatus Xenobia bacterium]
MKRGATLIEVLVASAISLVILGIGVVFLVTVLRASSRGLTQVELQQTSSLVLREMDADLRDTVVGAITLAPQPLTIGLQRLDHVTQSGQQTFETSLVIYQFNAASQLIVRHVVPNGTAGLALQPSAPATLSQATLLDAARAPDPHVRILCRDVTGFTFDPPGVNTPARISITVTRQAASGRLAPEQVTLTTEVALLTPLAAATPSPSPATGGATSSGPGSGGGAVP